MVLPKVFCLTNFVRGPFCFTKILVSKKNMDEMVGEFQGFPSEIFCLTVPKKIVGEPFSVSLFSGIEKC